MAPLRGPRFRSHAGRPLRTFREARRRGRLSAAAGCGEHTVRWSPTVTTTQSTRLSEPWRTRSLTPEQSSSATSAVASSRKCSRPAGRAETPEAGGKGIARPEQPREPKQSWRAQSPHASMSAIPTARQVCRAADSQQAQSRVAWARAGPRDRGDLDHTIVAWPGVAVISSLPAHALRPIVLSDSDALHDRISERPTVCPWPGMIDTGS